MGYLRKNLRILYAFNFLKSVQFFGAVAVPFYTDWAGLDYVRMFALEAFFVFSVFALEIPTGVVADRWGRKRSLAAGGAFAGAAFVLFGLTRVYALFVLAQFLCAVGFSLISGADRALLYDTLKAHGADADGSRVLARYGAAETAGIVVGFPLGSLFVGSALLPYPRALPWSFIGTGAMFCLSSFAALALTEPARDGRREGSFLKAGFAGVRFIFANARMRAASIDYVFVSAFAFFVYWFYQPLSREAGLPIGANGFVGAGFNLFSAFLLLNASRIERTLPLKTLLFVSSIVPGIAFLLLAANRSAFVVLPAVFAVAGLKHLRAPFLQNLMNAELDGANRATVLSGVSMFERALIMFLYPIVGFLADRSLSFAFCLLGAGIVAFSLAPFLFRRRRVQ